MLEIDAAIIDPPIDFSRQTGCGDGYFAVLFADPDGLTLEVAHIPRANP